MHLLTGTVELHVHKTFKVDQYQSFNRQCFEFTMCWYIPVFQYFRGLLQREWRLSLQKELHEENKGKWVCVALEEVLSQHMKELFALRAIIHWSTLPKGCHKVPITGGSQNGTCQNAR